CDQINQAGDKNFWRRTGNSRACGVVVREKFAAGFQKLESVVCRWSGWTEHVPANVGANEAARRRLHRGHFGRNEERDANNGRESTNHFRRRGSVAISGGIDWKSGQGADRRHCFWRQHRSEEVLRVDKLISSM